MSQLLRYRTLELVIEAPAEWNMRDIAGELFDLVNNVTEDTELRLVEARTVKVNIDKTVIS